MKIEEYIGNRLNSLDSDLISIILVSDMKDKYLSKDGEKKLISILTEMRENIEARKYELKRISVNINGKESDNTSDQDDLPF